MSEHPIQGMMGTSMEKLRDMVDVNTVVGEPIKVSETITIIPVSKVTFGFASGGSDFPSKSQKDLFGGGTGGGVTIQPISFIVINGNDVKMLQILEHVSSADKAIESIPDVLSKVKDIFSKDSKKEKAKKESNSSDEIEY